MIQTINGRELVIVEGLLSTITLFNKYLSTNYHTTPGLINGEQNWTCPGI